MQDDFPDHTFFKVEKVIEKVLKQNNLEEVLYFSRILNHWEVIVGEPLSKKALPLKLVKRSLYVGVVDSAYSHHLRFFESNILELIASPEICGEGAVRKIIFRIIQKKTVDYQEPEQALPATVQKVLSEPDRERVNETALQIRDNRLQKIFSRYMGKIVSK